MQQKKVWIKIEKWDKDAVIASLESGADAVVLPCGYTQKVRELGKIQVISSDGDLKPDVDVERVVIDSKEDEKKALTLSRTKTVIVSTPDWTVIPLENLVARSESIFAEVKDFEQARLCLHILEKGVAGIVLVNSDIGEIKKTISFIKQISPSLQIQKAQVVSTRAIGIGDRVCIDTTSIMKKGEGILVGNTSSGFFLVHAETEENPYVASRPFRVNAGGVHAYCITSWGKTMYLSELKSGDEVLIVDYKGKNRLASVGRIKIETRPMLLIEAKVLESPISLILQNAETINLTCESGEPVSVTKLKPGDNVLVYIEKSGRHFGIQVEETIVER
ncbi:3-dehydroquinate synthase II [bacterium Unc6]|nr:3-dehydroquinate synthase II [bacterium Unc6]